MHEQLCRVGKQAAGFTHAMAKLATARLLNVHALELDTNDKAYARTMSIVLSRWRRSLSFALHRGNANCIVQGVRNSAPAAAAVVHDGGKARRPVHHEDLGPRRRSLAEQAELPTPSPHAAI